MKYTYEDLDERIIKTRLALTGAILNLIKNQKKTKVLDICHEADITPMTYYHHFDNRQQLLEYAIKSQLSCILPIPKKLKPISIKHLFYYLLTTLNQFVNQNREVILSSIKNKTKGNSYFDLSFKIINELVKDEVRLLMRESEWYIDLATNLVCGAIQNILLQIVMNHYSVNNQNLWLWTKSILQALI